MSSTSKAAVIGMTRGHARELGKENIRVNAIAPSGLLTERTQEFFRRKTHQGPRNNRRRTILPRNLIASDLAGTAIWLLSGRAASQRVKPS